MNQGYKKHLKELPKDKAFKEINRESIMVVRSIKGMIEKGNKQYALQKADILEELLIMQGEKN